MEDDDYIHSLVTIPVWTTALIIIGCILPCCLCCCACNEGWECGRKTCFKLKKGQKATMCLSGDCNDMGWGCNSRSCCCTPPSTEVNRLFHRQMAFWITVLLWITAIFGLLSYGCDGDWWANNWDDDWDDDYTNHIDNMASRHASYFGSNVIRHSAGHLQERVLDREATRRGHCLSLDAEIAWSQDVDGTNSVPTGWMVERHASAHATFGLQQWVPGYGEAVEITSPANGCGPLANTFAKGGVALVERGTCTFLEKAYHAQEAGADAVVIYELPAAVGHGENDCKSIHHHTDEANTTLTSAWCYTAPGVCSDGEASNRFVDVEWSLDACQSGAGGCSCTSQTKDDFKEARSWSYDDDDYDYTYDDDADWAGPNEHWWSRDEWDDDWWDDDYAPDDGDDANNAATTMHCTDLVGKGPAIACDSIKVPVLMLPRTPANLLLATLKTKPHTKIDLMCEQVKPGAADTVDSTAPVADGLTEDTGAATTGSGSGASDLWELKNLSNVQSSYYRPYSYSYDWYDDDDATLVAQSGNRVCNVMALIATTINMWILMPCRKEPTNGKVGLRVSIALAAITFLVFFAAWILTWFVSWDACISSHFMYPIAALLAPIALILQARLLRAVAARLRAEWPIDAAAVGVDNNAPTLQRGVTNPQYEESGIAMTDISRMHSGGASSTDADGKGGASTNTGYIDVGPGASVMALPAAL